MRERQRDRFLVASWTIRLAPALGMAAIVASALFMTEPEPRWVQVIVGPTDTAGKVAWRLQVKHGTLERQLPAAARLNFAVSFAEQSRIEREVTVDDDGLAWVTFERPALALHQPLHVTVREGSHVLANGSVFVAERQWQSGERLEGGWCPGHQEGARDIRLGVVDGLILHSVPAAIVVALSEDGRALPHERITIAADGAEILSTQSTTGKSSVDLFTDESGIAHFSVRTTDLAATLRVTSGARPESSYTGALPVRAGGFAVAQHANTLEITSPIGLEHATLGLLTERGLVDVRTVALTQSGSGTSARIAYDTLPPKPLWAMVSSEAQLDAGNTIGWPLLGPDERSTAHPSLVVPNRLALDGYAAVTARLERQRRRAWTTSTGALLLVGGLLVWAVIHSNRRNQRQLVPLERLLASNGAGPIAERAPYALIAVIVLTSAIVALVWWLSLA